MISNRLANLAETQSVYSVEDLYVMMEIFIVNRHNKRLAENEVRKMQKAKR